MSAAVGDRLLALHGKKTMIRSSRSALGRYLAPLVNHYSSHSSAVNAWTYSREAI